MQYFSWREPNKDKKFQSQGKGAASLPNLVCCAMTLRKNGRSMGASMKNGCLSCGIAVSCGYYCVLSKLSCYLEYLKPKIRH